MSVSCVYHIFILKNGSVAKGITLRMPFLSSSKNIVRGQGEQQHFSRVLLDLNVNSGEACLLNLTPSSTTSSSSPLCIEGLLIFASKLTGETSSGETISFTNIKVNVRTFSFSQIPLWVLYLITHGLLALVSLVLWCQLVNEHPADLRQWVKCILLLSISVLAWMLGLVTQLVDESNKLIQYQILMQSFPIPG